MKITATPLTATLSDVWTVLGMSIFSDLPTPWRTSIVFLAFAIVFFVIPMKLFVEGIDSTKRRGWRDYVGFSRRYWREVPGFLSRSLFWFAGVVIAAVVLSFFEK